MAHWTYKGIPDATSLEQGDLLKKTPALNNILAEYHPYYASHPDNTFFLVITQSCDLARRGPQAECKSRYISLAPVRSLKSILKREFDKNLENIATGAQPFASLRVKGSLEQFLERLFNNNDSSFFYLENHPTVGVASDMCALLSLPIAIKAEHYGPCMDARVLSIQDEFQAKLGWLIGQSYSRVGTRDWPQDTLRNKITDSITKAAMWIPDDEAKALVAVCYEAKRADPELLIDAKKLVAYRKSLPKKKAKVIDRILDIGTLCGVFANPSPARYNFRKALDGDSEFSSFFNQ